MSRIAVFLGTISLVLERATGRETCLKTDSSGNKIFYRCHTPRVCCDEGCCLRQFRFKYHWYFWVSATLFFLFITSLVYFYCRWKSRRAPVITVTTWRESTPQSACSTTVVDHAQPAFIIGPPPSYASCVPPGHIFAPANPEPPPSHGPPPAYRQGTDSLHSTGPSAPPLYATVEISHQSVNAAAQENNMHNRSTSQPNLQDSTVHTPKPPGRLPPIESSVLRDDLHKTL